MFDGDSTLADLLSSTLIKPLQTERDESMRHLEMSYIKALGSYPDSQVILKTLQSDNFVEKLAEALWEGAKRLHEDSLESADDEQTGISKFFDDEGTRAETAVPFFRDAWLSARLRPAPRARRQGARFWQHVSLFPRARRIHWSAQPQPS